MCRVVCRMGRVSRVENQCEQPEGRRVLCLPPRDHGESLKEEERVGAVVGRERGRTSEREGTALLDVENQEGNARRKGKKVPVDGDSKAENPKGSTRLAISLGQ